MFREGGPVKRFEEHTILTDRVRLYDLDDRAKWRYGEKFDAISEAQQQEILIRTNGYWMSGSEVKETVLHVGRSKRLACGLGFRWEPMLAGLPDTRGLTQWRLWRTSGYYPYWRRRCHRHECFGRNPIHGSGVVRWKWWRGRLRCHWRQRRNCCSWGLVLFELGKESSRALLDAHISKSRYGHPALAEVER